MRRAAAVLALLAATLGLGVQRADAAPQAEPAQAAANPPSLPGSPACGPSLAPSGAPQTGRNDTGTRDPAPIYFAHDFPLFADSDANTTLGAVGGFGGIRFRGPLHHTPIVFVHGNQADAQNWLDPMVQLQQQAGYTMQEMYALSYNGLANYYAGAPEQMEPSKLDQLYVEQNSNTLANGGKGAGDDDNVPDLCRFVEEVQWYTGSRQVDIVAHSLGVTIARRMMELYPSLARDVVAFVGVAGANHGTGVCTGLSTSYYGCDEIAPGTQWLADLNAHGETYGPTRWMTVYNGSEGDPFYVGPTLWNSPELAGADNETFNANTTGAPEGHGDYHNDLRVDPPEVDTYLAFVLRHGQAGPGAAHGVDALAASIAAAGATAKANNQQAPSVYSLGAGSLCIPDLTGTQVGCTLTGSPVTVDSSSGTPQGNPAPLLSAIPNTSAPGPATPGATVAAALALLAIAGIGVRRRRRGQRIPVS